MEAVVLGLIGASAAGYIALKFYRSLHAGAGCSSESCKGCCGCGGGNSPAEGKYRRIG